MKMVPLSLGHPYVCRGLWGCIGVRAQGVGFNPAKKKQSESPHGSFLNRTLSGLVGLPCLLGEELWPRLSI